MVIPAKDPLTTAVLECSGWLQGAFAEHVHYSGPAYRTLPPDPCPLFQLRPEKQDTMPEGTHSRDLPREVAEAWAGCAAVVGELIRVGFVGRAYECSPNGTKGDYLPEGDIERPENQQELFGKIKHGSLYQLHVAPDCKSWSILQNLNVSSRTQDCPQGDGSLDHEIAGNRSAAVALWLVWQCALYGVFVSLEHPLTSRLWTLPIVA